MEDISKTKEWVFLEKSFMIFSCYVVKIKMTNMLKNVSLGQHSELSYRAVLVKLDRRVSSVGGDGTNQGLSWAFHTSHSTPGPCGCQRCTQNRTRCPPYSDQVALVVSGSSQYSESLPAELKSITRF